MENTEGNQQERQEIKNPGFLTTLDFYAVSPSTLDRRQRGWLQQCYK